MDNFSSPQPGQGASLIYPLNENQLCTFRGQNASLSTLGPPVNRLESSTAFSNTTLVLVTSLSCRVLFACAFELRCSSRDWCNLGHSSSSWKVSWGSYMRFRGDLCFMDVSPIRAAKCQIICGSFMRWKDLKFSISEFSKNETIWKPVSTHNNRQ